MCCIDDFSIFCVNFVRLMLSSNVGFGGSGGDNVVSDENVDASDDKCWCM